MTHNYYPYPAFLKYLGTEVQVLLTAVEYPHGVVTARSELIDDDGGVVMTWDLSVPAHEPVHLSMSVIGAMMKEAGHDYVDARWAEWFLEDDPAYFVFADGVVLHLPELAEDWIKQWI